MQFVSAISVLVPDYDKAIEFYVAVMGFELLEDTRLSLAKRWVRVRPKGSGHKGAAILLAKASGAIQEEAVGHQAGGRVFLFLTTDDFDRDYSDMREKGVRFCEGPRCERYGTVAVFEDPFGNKWDLIQPSSPADISKSR